jgi:hypothetical protein
VPLHIPAHKTVEEVRWHCSLLGDQANAAQLLSMRTNSVYFPHRVALRGNNLSNHPQDLNYTASVRVVHLNMVLDGKNTVEFLASGCADWLSNLVWSQ